MGRIGFDEPEDYDSEDPKPTTHTPKPWLRNAENAHHIVDREGYTIADVARAKDAPIIAAAPELLEAAKLALDYYRSYGTLKYNAAEVEHTLEQAIAKAERGMT